MTLLHLVGVTSQICTRPLRRVLRNLRKARQEFQVKRTRLSIRECRSVFSATCRVALKNFLLSGATLSVPASNYPSISVIVISTMPEYLLACLRTLQEQRFEEMEIILVDNAPSGAPIGTSTGEMTRLLGRVQGVRIIRGSEGAPFVQSVNRAAQESRGEFLLLLSPGLQMQLGAMRAALDTIRTSTDIGAVGAKLVLANGTIHEAGSIFWQEGSFTAYGRGEDALAPAYNFRRRVDSCSEIFLLTRKNVWNRLGGLDETFARSRGEVMDYCARLWERGLQVVYEPSATGIYYKLGDADPGSSPGIQGQVLFSLRHAKLLSDHAHNQRSSQLAARSSDDRTRVLILDDCAPHPWMGSGYPRACTFLRALHRCGYFVTLYPLSAANEPLDTIYSDIPRDVEIVHGPGMDQLESFLQARRGYYSKIVVSRPHNMRTLKPIIESHPDWFSRVTVIYDAEALFTLRDISLRELTGGPLSSEMTMAAIQEEIDLTSIADQIVSVSDAERQVFIDHGIPKQKTFVLGHSLEIAPTVTPFDERSGLLFVGAIHDGSPNADSLWWFLNEVFPRIQKALGNTIGLTIAGINTCEKLQALAGETIRITGPVPSLRHLYETSRLFIAPTRFAAGISHKVHEAAAAGLPVVTTSLVAAQLGWSGRKLCIADSPEEFAASCIQAYTDEMRWNAMRRAALERVQVDCSPEAFDRTVAEILRSDHDSTSIRSFPNPKTSSRKLTSTIAG